MPRYFFDTDDGDRAEEDDEGLTLADEEAARRAAVETLPDMARDMLPLAAEQRRDITVTIRDEAGNTIYSAYLTLAGTRHVAGWNR